MIITINLKNYPFFIKTIFLGKKKFYLNLINSIETIKEIKQKEELLSILNYLFLAEYKDLYFRKNEVEQDQKLENIFIEKQIFFSSMNLCISGYDNETYSKIMEILSKFDLNYNNFCQINKDIQFEDLNEYKLHIAQSIIRVAFSKKKLIILKKNIMNIILLKELLKKMSKKLVKNIKIILEHY